MDCQSISSEKKKKKKKFQISFAAISTQHTKYWALFCVYLYIYISVYTAFLYTYIPCQWYEHAKVIPYNYNPSIKILFDKYGNFYIFNEQK